ncbi:MAG: endolytic transglycosylase MltG [Gammaproteobacteria bacterium]
MNLLRRTAKFAAGAAVFAILIGAGAWGWRQYEEYAFAQTLARPLPAFQFDIPSGATVREIAAMARAAGSPLDEKEFAAAAQKLNIAHKLQAGRYEFTAGETAGEMLSALAGGKTAPAFRITIVEGVTYKNLRDMLRGDSRLAQKLPSMKESEILRALDIERDSAEGLFLPETYFFNHGDSDFDVLRRARKGMKTLLDSLWETRQDGGLFGEKYEALTLASIVEKETGAAEERPLIASVFANRLRKGIPLQADPTIIYGLGDGFDGNLKRVHLRDKKNPYNTYARRGLTPTPIALPGKAALAAVLNPPATKYYYFVASGGGKHVFSKTLREHNNAVNKYQRRRKK